MNESDAE
jgi:hypothetical protein